LAEPPQFLHESLIHGPTPGRSAETHRFGGCLRQSRRPTRCSWNPNSCPVNDQQTNMGKKPMVWWWNPIFVVDVVSGDDDDDDARPLNYMWNTMYFWNLILMKVLYSCWSCCTNTNAYCTINIWEKHTHCKCHWMSNLH
jgi:hypothetical protein